MKKSSIIANLVVSCVFLAISLAFLISSPCFGIIFFAIALAFTIINSVKLSNYNKQESYYQNPAPDMNQNYQSPEPEKGNALFIFITVLCCVSFSCCLFNNLALGKHTDKVEENSSQSEQETEEKEIKTTTTETVTQKTTKAKTTSTVTSTTTSTTTTPVQLELAQLYLDFFEPYINSVGKLTPQTFRQDNSGKFADYDVTITEGNEEDLWKFEIKDSNNNYMTFWFFPDNDVYKNPPEDWHWTLCLITYNNGSKEISISDNFHNEKSPVYNTSDKSREKVNQKVKSVDELKKFIFIAKENSTETTTTTVVTEPPTEPPTPAPTNPPTEPPPPPAPVVVECDFVLNTSTMKAHYPNCRDVNKIDPENRWDYYGTVEDVQSMGYSSCGHCHTW